jgi:hypothetical protein
MPRRSRDAAVAELFATGAWEGEGVLASVRDESLQFGDLVVGVVEQFDGAFVHRSVGAGAENAREVED